MKPGEVVQLGRHRLICGDATSSDDVRALLGDRTVDTLLTDPPYGADLLEKWESQKRISLLRPEWNSRRDSCGGDAEGEVADWRVFFASFLRRVPWSDYNTAYIFMSHANLHHLRLACDDTKIHVSDYLVWNKNRISLGRRDYQSRYEPILYGWHKHHRFHGAWFQPNVLDHKRAGRNRWHPCQKPLDLCARLIANGAPAGGLVYDPFAGGGTTLLAAEHAGREARLIEMVPERCDAILERWEQRADEFAALDGTALAAWGEQK